MATDDINYCVNALQCKSVTETAYRKGDVEGAAADLSHTWKALLNNVLVTSHQNTLINLLISDLLMSNAPTS
jgi:hypothetical protein